ncbi:MAG: ATP-binding protein [Candidatus Altiarchaeota archaeon]
MEDNLKEALEKQNPWWFGKEFECGINRLESYPQLEKFMGTPEVLLLLGARRTGKSTLLSQLIKTLLDGKTPPEAIVFANLDDPLLQSRSKDPSFLGGLIEHYLTKAGDCKRLYVFIDEVQNNDYWVQTVKTVYDTQKKVKLVLTGSTSTLLQGEGSTRLSGRYFHTVIFPLSFKEFLEFKEIKKPTLAEKNILFEEYLKYGGFPRVVLEKGKGLKHEILKNYFQTIYLKDIVYPHKIRNNREVFDLLYFILSNVGKPFSFANMAKTLGIAAQTVGEYIAYAENSYLIHTINKYDKSVRKQLANQKKTYCIDTGLASSVSFRFLEDRGRLLENLVYLALKRRYEDIFYHKSRYECDFLIKERLKITHAIQVSLTLKDEETRKREVRGLLEAMDEHKLREGLIVTANESMRIKEGGKRITVKSAHEWLLELEI